MDIGKRIRKARKKIKLTQKEFGLAVFGVESGMQNKISRIESGHQKPTIEELTKIAEYLNVDVSFFTKETKNKNYEFGIGAKPLNDISDAIPNVVKEQQSQYLSNSEILKHVILGIETTLEKQKYKISVKKKTDLIILLYEHYAETKKPVNAKTIEKYLQLVAA